MNRVFLTLYFVIVGSLIFLGWGADRLWQVFGSDNESSLAEQSLFHLVETDEIWRSEKNVEVIETYFSARLPQKIKIFHISDFAKSHFLSELNSGGIVLVHDEEGVVARYKRVGSGEKVIRLLDDYDVTKTGGKKRYLIFLVGFYIAMAIAIYFWVWPLSRDLKKLQRETKKIGSNSVSHVELNPSSAVLGLATAFNSMAERINNLLASHKEMTYAVSHEMRTPLARMKFALEMAENAKNESELKKQLKSWREDIAEMDALITELLAYASFEQKNQTLTYSPGDLGALVCQLVSRIQDGDRYSSIDIEIDNQIESEAVLCEWYLMERCIYNLLQNAEKYCASKVQVRLLMQKNNYLVEIEDDGPGVIPENREKIFEAFVRVRDESTENKSGFGLGLAIVKRIAKWHQGDVTVKSSNLGGAKFSLQWPKPDKKN